MPNIKKSTSLESPVEQTNSLKPAPPLHSHSKKRKRKTAEERPNVYSAVAGHVSYRETAHKHTRLNARKPLAPQDVLFERYSAPDRYAEPQLDWYGAHRWLRPHTTTREGAYAAQTLDSGSYAVKWAPWEEPGAIDGRVPDVQVRQGVELSSEAIRARQLGLPDSDLCKAVHRYASAFYATLEQHAGVEWAAESRPSRRGSSTARKARLPASSFRSLDETALLCFAILLEETMAAQVSGFKAGDLEGWRALTVGLSDRGDEVAQGGSFKEQRRQSSSPPAIGRTAQSRSRSRSRSSSASNDASDEDVVELGAKTDGSGIAYDPDDY